MPVLPRRRRAHHQHLSLLPAPLFAAGTPPAPRPARPRAPRPLRERPSLAAALVVLAFFLLVTPLVALAPWERTAASPAPTGLHVAGNQLLTGAGQPLVLHGVNRSGLEYACIQGWGFFDGDDVLNDDSQAPLMKNWGVNAVNLGLNEDCWLGINGVPAAYGGANYQAAIVHEVQTLESSGITPILSLFWEAPGTQKATDQIAMPDADHAPALWQSVATTFKGDSAVIFRLKEEPYPEGNSDGAAAWNCWLHGGSACSEGYAAVGMQSLIDTIRATGATNVIQVPGVQYANSLTQFLTYRPSDPLNNLMAAVDVYPVGNLCGATSCYDSEYAPVAAAMPLVAGEFGESVDGNTCTTTHVDALMGWFDAHGAGYLGWSWDTWGGCLQLIGSYSTGAPNGAWGNDLKNRLLALAGNSPTSPTATAGTPAPSPTATATGTKTPTVAPTNTPPPATSTPTPTNTPVPPPSATATKPAPTATNTPLPPTPTKALPTPTSTTGSTPVAPPTVGSVVLYDNAFRNGFSDGSFAALATNPCDTTTYTSPSCSYALTPAAWGALSFRHQGFNTSGYVRFEFTVRLNGQPISNYEVEFFSQGDALLGEVFLTQSNVVATLPNGWVRVSVPVSHLNPGNAKLVREIDIQSTRQGKLPKANFDDVRLVSP